MIRNNIDIDKEYFDWLYNLVCRDLYADAISYKELFLSLYNTEFTWIIRKDENRCNEGLILRYRFSMANGYSDDMSRYIKRPCSVLEMMVALAIKCEENIMDDPTIGDRTKQWFWGMINSLGLGGMYDRRFDKNYVDDVLKRFLNRDYAPNGVGGLFTIKNCEDDLRNVEIWVQLCWYLDKVIGY